MTKKEKELNMTMDLALAGVTAGYVRLEGLIYHYLGVKASNVKLDTLHEILQDRHNLGKALELLSRPVETKRDGTLYYKGGSR